MGLAVVTVASGGLPVTDVTSRGAQGRPAGIGGRHGIAVTKVASGGMPVVYVSPPLLREANGRHTSSSKSSRENSG